MWKIAHRIRGREISEKGLQFYMGWSESAYWTGDILGKYKEADGVIWAGIWKKDFNTHRTFMKDPELVPLVQNEKDRDNTVAIKTYSK